MLATFLSPFQLPEPTRASDRLVTLLVLEIFFVGCLFAESLVNHTHFFYILEYCPW